MIPIYAPWITWDFNFIIKSIVYLEIIYFLYKKINNEYSLQLSAQLTLSRILARFFLLYLQIQTQ